MTLQVTTARWPALPRPQQSAAIGHALADGRSVLLVGEQGVGKTHLAADALASLDNGPGADAAPVLTLSGASVTDTAGPALPSWLTSLLARTPTGAGTGAGQRPVVRVEDADHLVTGIAHSLVQLAREDRIQLLAAVRPSAASRAPWLQLWKDGIAHRVDVPAFTAGEAEELLEAALGGPMTADTCRRIVERSRGNAFYLREIVLGELEAGTLVEQDGVWVGLVDAPLSPRVLDLVRNSLTHLAPDVREALDLLALNHDLPLTELADLVDDSALDQLAREGLVAVGHAGSLSEVLVPTARIGHPMYGETVRELVPLERQRRLHAAVRAVQTSPVTKRSQTPTALLRTVLWALRCGARETTERMLTALRVAYTRTEWQAVIRISHAVWSALEGDAPARADVLLLRASAWFWLNEPGHVSRDLADVGRLLDTLAPGPEHDGLRVRHVDQLADLDQFHANDADKALARIRRAREELSGTASPEHVRALEVVWLSHLGLAGRFQESVEPSLELLYHADSSLEVLPVVDPTIYGLAQLGRFEEARAIGEEGLAVARAAGDRRRPWQVDHIVVALYLSVLWSGDIPTAERMAAEPATPSGYSEHEVFVQVGRGLLAAAQGNWSVARRELESAAARYSLYNAAGVGAYVTAAAAVAAAATGDAPRARVLIQRTRETPLRISASVEADLRLQLLDAGAWLRVPTQREDAAALARWAAGRGLWRAELEALHRIVVGGYLLGSPDPVERDVLDRIGELAEQVDGPRARALLVHAEAIAAGDDHVTLVGARELGRCGLWLPSRGVSADLTRREREIASLAAGGLSSRVIAERFTLSVRTVDSHLSRVFTKLGVRSRHELAAALSS